MQSVARILRAHATCFLEFFHEQLKGKMQHIAVRSVYLPRVTEDARCMDVEVNVDAILRARGDARHGARPDNASLRIVLLDEQTLSRQAMKSLLLQNRRVQCVLDVSTIDECVSVATQQGARVIILSLDGDQGDRVQQVRTLASKVSGAHVLAIGHDIEPSRLLAIIGAGAVGFVATTANENELGDAIEEVASGGIYVDGLTTRALASGLRDMALDTTHNSARAQLARLSERERTVLRLVARGFSGPQIAEQLRITAKTVDTYRHRIHEKLGLRHRAEYVTLAMHAGVLLD